MGLKCTLGLIACLNYNGTMIDESDAFVITVYCNEIEGLPANTFLMNSSYNPGYWKADELERLGLNFKWKPKAKVSEYQLGRFREVEIKRACREFILKVENPRMWKNLK
tara:strand:+ start:179 stop:505 length:327 start_codon:yes stop_codon:yes gene_type:complete